MSKYISLNDIKKDFGIQSDDLEDVRKYVNDIRIKNHPDKNNGVFANKESEEIFYQANNAIEYIDNLSGTSNSVIVIEKMTDLMKVVSSLIPNQTHTILENNLDTKITTAISDYHSKLAFPKISLTALTAIVSFIFLFPNQIKDNPALSNHINPASRLFFMIWLSLLIYSAMFWMITYMNEEKAKRKMSLLKVDSFQNRLFEDFMLTNNKDIFTKDRFVEFLFDKLRGRGTHSAPTLNLFLMNPFRSELITPEISQNIAEIVISRAEKNNVIVKLTNNSLSESYRILNYVESAPSEI